MCFQCQTEEEDDGLPQVVIPVCAGCGEEVEEDGDLCYGCGLERHLEEKWERDNDR